MSNKTGYKKKGKGKKKKARKKYKFGLCACAKNKKTLLPFASLTLEICYQAISMLRLLRPVSDADLFMSRIYFELRPTKLILTG